MSIIVDEIQVSINGEKYIEGIEEKGNYKLISRRGHLITGKLKEELTIPRDQSNGRM